MTDDATVISETLERVAERVGDPATLVFKRLFAESPEVEDLFVRDPNGLVRGQMFQVTIESLLDFLGDRSYGANLVQIERVNHQGLGVEPKCLTHSTSPSLRRSRMSWAPTGRRTWRTFGPER